MSPRQQSDGIRFPEDSTNDSPNERPGSPFAQMMQALYDQYQLTGDPSVFDALYGPPSLPTYNHTGPALLEGGYGSVLTGDGLDDNLPEALYRRVDGQTPVTDDRNEVTFAAEEGELLSHIPEAVDPTSIWGRRAQGTENMDIPLIPFNEHPSSPSSLLHRHISGHDLLDAEPPRYDTDADDEQKPLLGPPYEAPQLPTTPEMGRSIDFNSAPEGDASEPFALRDTEKNNHLPVDSSAHSDAGPSRTRAENDISSPKSIPSRKRKRVERENLPALIYPTGKKEDRRSDAKKMRAQPSVSTCAGPSSSKDADPPRPRRTNDKLEPIEMRPKTRCGLDGCSELLKAPELGAARAHMKSHLPKFTGSQAKANHEKTSRKGKERATNADTSKVAGPSNTRAGTPTTRASINCPYIAPGGTVCEHEPFVNLQSLQRHIEGDHYDWGFQCPHCNRWFKRRDALIRHKATEHPQSKPQ
ncbi:hypothetical protein C8Q77DRAFT_1156295 [Trametes polyzona]|nr:hypothetical protein C8Q77DRAFT_1156295 [Trametes polyzona]